MRASNPSNAAVKLPLQHHTEEMVSEPTVLVHPNNALLPCALSDMQHYTDYGRTPDWRENDEPPRELAIWDQALSVLIPYSGSPKQGSNFGFSGSIKFDDMSGRLFK
jgi:hypothetical protein